MAVIEVNQQGYINKVYNASADRLRNASVYIADGVVSKLIEGAGSRGVSSLCSPAVWDTDTYYDDTAHGVVNNEAISVRVSYNQRYLEPPVGSDTENWSHTSPILDDPQDYRDLVNSGVSGSLFKKKPSWAGAGGFWDEAMNSIPEIVNESLSMAGLSTTFRGAVKSSANTVGSAIKGWFKKFWGK